MNILITGANGCLGCEIVKLLQNENHKLYLVDRNFSNFNNEDSFEFIKADITNLQVLNSLIGEIDCIIHLAAKVHIKPKTEEDKNEFYEVNYEATKKLYEFALESHVKHFLFISSISVYGDKTESLVNEESDCNPVSDYAKSKLMAEEEGFRLFETKQLPITVFRLATVFGPNDRGNYGKLISAVRKGCVPVVGRGESLKPIVYVKDVAEILVLVLFDSNFIGDKFIISEGNYLYNDIISNIESVFNKKAFKIKIPVFVLKIMNFIGIGRGIVAKLKTLDSSFSVDNSKLKNKLDFKYKYNFTKGLKDSSIYYNE